LGTLAIGATVGATAAGIAGNILGKAWGAVSDHGDSAACSPLNNGWGPKVQPEPAWQPWNAPVQPNPQPYQVTGWPPVAPAPAPVPAPAQPQPYQPFPEPEPKPDAPPPEAEVPSEYSNGGGWVPVSAPPQPASTPKPEVPQPQSPTQTLPGAQIPSAQAQPEAEKAPKFEIQAQPVVGKSQEKGQGKTMRATTVNDPIACRKFPDTISSSTLPPTIFSRSTRIEVTCWTTASLAGAAGKVQNDAIWLQTSTGCFVNEQNLLDSTDFQEKLPYCVPPTHWVGTAEKKDTKQLCYQCPSLKCPSEDLGSGSYVDVQCYVDGEDARGNK
jgi:hypothetical protein